MASPALGGVLAGLMAGWEAGDQKTRERVADKRAADEYDYVQGRRKVVDQQQDTTFGLGLQDRERRIRREDTQDARTGTLFDQQQQDREHALTRRPILERREDEQYGLQTALTKQQMAQSKAQHGVHMNEAAIRAEMARMGLDDAKIQRQAQRAQRAVLGAVATADVTGDWSAVAGAINATLGQDHGYQVKSIREQKDGSFVVDFGGEPMVLPNKQALAEAAFKLTSPETYAHVLQSTIGQRMGATDPKNRPPAQVATADAVFSRLEPQEGESDAARWIRAFNMANSSKEMSPEARVQKFYADTLKAMLPAGATQNDVDRAKAAAKQLTDEFAKMQGVSATPAPSAASPGTQTSGRTIVRTGTTADGQRVALYSDGTIGPAPAQ